MEINLNALTSVAEEIFGIAGEELVEYATSILEDAGFACNMLPGHVLRVEPIVYPFPHVELAVRRAFVEALMAGIAEQQRSLLSP